MIHIRDFSIKKRLLFSNFFMIIIPVIFMALLSALVGQQSSPFFGRKVGRHFQPNLN